MMNGPYVPALDRPSLAASNGTPSSPSSGGGCGCSSGSPASGAESPSALGAPPISLPTPPATSGRDVRPADETPAGSPLDVAGIGLGLLVGLLVGGVATYALTRD